MAFNKNFNSKKTDCLGFTLIELSIVLIVIGLIVGGITVGQDMMNNAKLNTLISDKNKYELAVRNFKLKYNYLPGDMPNAYDYWGTDCGGNGAIMNVGLNHCNGDGNNQINTGSENLRAMEHLGFAELIEGNWPGFYNGASAATVNFTHPPTSSYDNVMLHLFYRGSYGGVDVNEHVLLMGTDDQSVWSGHQPFLSPLEAYYIDNKIDNGQPASGKVMAGQPYLSLPSTNVNRCSRYYVSGASKQDFYYVDYEAVTCAIQFPLGKL